MDQVTVIRKALKSLVDAVHNQYDEPDAELAEQVGYANAVLDLTEVSK